MHKINATRRDFLKGTVVGGGYAAMAAFGEAHAEAAPTQSEGQRGAQRLSVDALKKWEALQYGMFIHFGMSTFLGEELPDGKAPASAYLPDKLDVEQWVSVARDAGMRYAVLTAKHVAGHCLWPSAHTDYTVANSGHTGDVVGQFVEACRKRGVLPGLYYCSWDNHNRFGSVTPSDARDGAPAYTTSVYQTFQTHQIADLLDRYGPLAELWVDIPGVLGRGYRTYLYEAAAKRQEDMVIMMNSGISSGEEYDVDYAWPSDLIAIERNLPPGSGHKKWRTIEGKEYYLPGEVCDPIGKAWFYEEDDAPRSDEELLRMYESCKAGGVNLLLDVPPDRHGLIPEASVKALMRLQAHAGL